MMRPQNCPTRISATSTPPHGRIGRPRIAFACEQGSYRDSLKPAPQPDGGGLNMHALFRMLEDEGGETALRRFYDEVCVASPALRARLASHGALHSIRLGPRCENDRKHFPDFV